jgi:hypothetical protein
MTLSPTRMAAVSDPRHQPSTTPAPRAGGNGDVGHPRRMAARVQRLEAVVNRRFASSRTRQWLLVVAFALFVVISVLSFLSLPAGVHFRWWALPLLVVVTTPLTLIANSAEFRIMGAINGHVIGWYAAARLTVVASAANLLPLPGGIVVRTHALHGRGSSYRNALAANAAAGLAWIGVAALIIAALLATTAHGWVAPIALGVGGVACIVATLAVLRRVERPSAIRLLIQLIGVEAATVAVNAVRIFLAFRLIGLSATAAQSVALTASQIIAAAVGIFPAGLGLRELLAGGIGSAVGLQLAASIAATASDRIAGQSGMALLALLLLRRHHPSELSETATLPTTHLP